MDHRRYDIVNTTGIIPCEPWETGTGMAGYKWIAPNERAVLLFQHAFGDYTARLTQDRSRFIPHVLEQGISVYGIDMPGCGYSPGKRGAADPFAAIRHHRTARTLLADVGVPVFLAGHSLGGLVTATSMVKDESNVAGAILVAPALKYELNRPTRWLAQLGGSIVPDRKLPFRSGSVDNLTRDIHEQQKLLSDPLLDAPGVTWITAKGVVYYSFRNWSRYDRISVPVMAIHGTHDTATSPAGSVQFIDAVSSEDKTLNMIDGGLHDLFDDIVSDDGRDSIIGWMDARI